MRAWRRRAQNHKEKFPRCLAWRELWPCFRCDAEGDCKYAVSLRPPSGDDVENMSALVVLSHQQLLSSPESYRLLPVRPFCFFSSFIVLHAAREEEQQLLLRPSSS